MTRVQVKEGWCEGHGQCMFAAPEVFVVNDDDHVELLVDEIPAELLGKVTEAVRRCPRTTLELVDD